MKNAAWLLFSSLRTPPPPRQRGRPNGVESWRQCQRSNDCRRSLIAAALFIPARQTRFADRSPRLLAFLKQAHSFYCCTLSVSEASGRFEIGGSLPTVPNRYDVFAISFSLSKVSWAPFRWFHHQSTLRTTCPTNPTDNQGTEITVPSETTTVYPSSECGNFFPGLQIDDR